MRDDSSILQVYFTRMGCHSPCMECDIVCIQCLETCMLLRQADISNCFDARVCGSVIDVWRRDHSESDSCLYNVHQVEVVSDHATR